MTLRGDKPKQGLLLVPERGHPVAHALLGFGHDVQRQAPDVLECGSLGSVLAPEVVVNDCHTNER